MPRVPRALFVAAVATLVATALAAPAQADDRYTPVIQSVESSPKWFKDTNGRVHLVHELKLTNGFPVPVTVTGVTVRDRERRRVIERLDGDRLEAATSLQASPTEPETEIPGSGVGVVWFDIKLRRGARIPRSVRHTVTVKVPPGLPVPENITSSGGVRRVDRRRPIVLTPPVRGGGWIAVGSCCDGPHRRSLQPVNGRLNLGQRFAIDWNRMDNTHRWVVGDDNVNENWVFFGQPVLSVGRARVVKAVDRFQEQIANNPRPVGLREGDGNHVILRLGRGRYAFYAHLKAGSVRVREGQLLRPGQVIGLLGNTGSSTGPHLHFHVMSGPSALDADGLPYAFDRWTLTGRTPPLDDALIEKVNAAQPTPVDRTGSGARRGRLPLGRDVVRFRR